MTRLNALRRHGAWILLSAVLAATSAAHGEDTAPTWTVDKKNSRITFTAYQMGASAVGRFENFSADIAFDRDDLGRSEAVVEIDVASARTDNADIEAEIKKEKWFDVASYPTARFETRSFEKLEDGRYEAEAVLTLRGVEKEIALPFELDVTEEGDRLRANAVGEVEVMRLDFGIGQGEWQSTSIVKNEVLIRIELTATRPK